MTPATPGRPGRNPIVRWVTDRRTGRNAPVTAGAGGQERPASNFAVTVHDRGSDTVIAVTGELDIYTAPALRDALLDVVAAERSEIVVDLLGVAFLDSSALGVLVGGYKRVSTMGGHLRVACPPGPLTEIFRVTGLDRVLPLYTSVEDAVDDAR
ncbi:MAG TPA: STAS domain-containing protein [Mycobacteriales bacterium]|jgi:anti-sigma B factor antagonist